MNSTRSRRTPLCSLALAAAISPLPYASASVVLQYAFAHTQGDVTTLGAVQDISGAGNHGVVLTGNGGTYSPDIPTERRFTHGVGSLDLSSGSLATDAAGALSGVPLRVSSTDPARTLNHAEIVQANGLTLEAWVRGGSSWNGLAISLGGAFNLTFGQGYAGFVNGFNSEGAFAYADANAWTHLAGVLSNPRIDPDAQHTLIANMTLYLNGEAAAFAPEQRFVADLTRAAAFGDHPLAVATEPHITQPFDGMLFEPRISLGALTPAEFTVVPTPSAAALLGVAGVVSARRRR